LTVELGMLPAPTGMGIQWIKSLTFIKIFGIY
jgi:hypothetical protein